MKRKWFDQIVLACLPAEGKVCTTHLFLLDICYSTIDIMIRLMSMHFKCVKPLLSANQKCGFSVCSNSTSDSSHAFYLVSALKLLRVLSLILLDRQRRFDLRINIVIQHVPTGQHVYSNMSICGWLFMMTPVAVYHWHTFTCTNFF